MTIKTKGGIPPSDLTSIFKERSPKRNDQETIKKLINMIDALADACQTLSNSVEKLSNASIANSKKIKELEKN